MGHQEPQHLLPPRGEPCRYHGAHRGERGQPGAVALVGRGVVARIVPTIATRFERTRDRGVARGRRRPPHLLNLVSCLTSSQQDSVALYQGTASAVPPGDLLTWPLGPVIER